ncbi:MAG: kelch repeat-containing protein [Bacteroidia bacterium]
MYRLILILALLVSVNVVAQNGTWTWMRGSNSPNALGNYGVQGVASPVNEPPALYCVANWTDLNGNFWILGGQSFTNSWEAALWKYDVATNEWTWMKGPANASVGGVYGVQGVPSQANYPGSRGYGCICWTDLNGDLWLFGGNGADINANVGNLNDLWRYTIATNEWTWMGGSTSNGSLGNFGVFQVTALANWPPSRSESTVGWKDAQGNLWLYGGSDYDDVWKYDMAINQWTWMAGSNVSNPLPVHGMLQVASPLNTPGQRSVYSNWLDAQGNLWLYGGYTNYLQLESDMWKFDMTNYQWTWMAGITAQPDTVFSFTQQCTAGGRPRAVYENRAYWTDDCGRFWNFGGAGYVAMCDELWMFDPATLQFTWVSGTGIPFNPGNYGTIGVPASTNYPDPLIGGVAFKSLNGELWLFGGYTVGPCNALWRYQPSASCPAGVPPIVDLSVVDSSGCAPFVIAFSPSNTSYDSYTWDFGDLQTQADTSTTANTSYTYMQAGTYTVTLVVSDSTGCVIGADTITQTITVSALPQLELGNDTAFCDNNFSLLLDAENPSASWVWNTGALSQTITVNTTGEYSVIVTDQNNCSRSDSIAVSIINFSGIGDTISLCNFASGILLDAGTSAAQYLWTTGETTQSITINEPGIYGVVVSGSTCSFTDSVVVIGSSESNRLYLPNTFTPNLNGLNDIFLPKGDGVTSYQLRIFNRWGELIFETDDLNTGWDGTYQGRVAQEDVYVYVITYTVFCEREREFQKVGHLNLIR